MINVAISGCLGKMGQTCMQAVSNAQDLKLICGIDNRLAKSSDMMNIYPEVFFCSSVKEAVSSYNIDVLVDFTSAKSAPSNLKAAIARDVDCVLGTTGIPLSELEEIASECKGSTSLFFAPNFTTGAVLMMQFAKLAAPYFPQAEVIEYHHCNKLDAPSGTAVQTARLISSARNTSDTNAPGSETEIEGCEGARGANVEGVPVHSIRSDGFVANQEVVFGSLGQSLSIKHESWDRTSYMPGVLLGIRESANLRGLVVGLDALMGLS